MARLFFASLVTFGLLISMVIGFVLAGMVAIGEIDLGIAIALAVVINLVIWLISPWLSDLTLRWFNKLEFLDDATVKARYPGVHELIHRVADDYRFAAPRIGFIPDRNPTAFTYGLLRSNARIVVTEGIFDFLSEEEQRAVVAHELGHIVHRDFILMTMAGMLVQILYMIYVTFSRARSSSRKNAGPAIGLAALIAYYIGIYLLLYLSRTREYLADAFSASRIEPRALASALVKIAYGIVKVEDTEATQSLLRSTRHLGVIDVQNARYTGLLAESTVEPGAAAKAMLFDYFNPWAPLIQLNSTHPLTGRRIAHLGEIARAKGQSFGDYDVAAAAAQMGLDRGRLWTQFLAELLLLCAPVLLGVAAALFGAWQIVPAVIAAGVLATIPLRYPSSPVRSATVMALMGDPAASPVRGQAVWLEGKAIGRVSPGFVAGEDVIFQDKTGLMAVDFRSMLGFIGDLFAGWKRVPKHFDQQGEVTGWFRRGMGGYLVLKELKSTAGSLRAKPFFWQAALSVIVIVVNLMVVWSGTPAWM